MTCSLVLRALGVAHGCSHLVDNRTMLIWILCFQFRYELELTSSGAKHSAACVSSRLQLFDIVNNLKVGERMQYG